MPSYNQIAHRMGSCENGDQMIEYQKSLVRELKEYTNRNVIVYYSGFLTYEGETRELSINDADMTGLMTAVKESDRSKGLDLILHTPGGSPTAAESIVKYLKKSFNNDIRVIVPHMAMSAGTMIACASKEIIMGNHSSLGPIDPQFQGIPAYNIKSEFEEAEAALATNPEKVQFWAIRLQQYPAAFLKSAIDAIELSSVLVKQWLGDAMFNSVNDEVLINKIVEELNEHDISLVHDRHYDIDKCREMGLKVTSLEDDPELQDKVLSINHATQFISTNMNGIKIIVNETMGYFTMG